MKKLLLFTLLITILLLSTGCQKPKKDPNDLSSYNLNKLTTDYEIESNKEENRTFLDYNNNIELITIKNKETYAIDINVIYRIPSIQVMEQACLEISGIIFGTYYYEDNKYDMEKLMNIQVLFYEGYPENIRVNFKGPNGETIGNCRIEDSQTIRLSSTNTYYKEQIAAINRKYKQKK